MRIFSTFTGIGGFEIGIQNAYRNKNSVGSSQAPGHKEKNGQRLQRPSRQSTRTAQRLSSPGATNQTDERPLFVGYSEVDKYAISVYEKHFKGVTNYGDITKINEKELPDFDCIVGGFPCQSFSVAGKRGGFRDTRGTLFFDLARIIREKQPRYFVFENVKGLLSHDQGRTYTTIIATLDELGYDCQWQVLNSKDFGVPQNRERIIIVGHLRGTPRPQVFPITTGNQNYIKEITQAVPQSQRLYDRSGISPAIDSAAGGNRQPKIVAMRGRGEPLEQVLEPRADNITNSLTSVQKDNLVAKTIRSGGRGSPHGSKQNWDSYEIGGTIRRLTPLECERLQAFPDNWTKFGVDAKDNVIPISDTQRYKMCGNAVTTNVIQAVFERLI